MFGVSRLYFLGCKIQMVDPVSTKQLKFTRDKRNNCVKNNAIQNTYYKSTKSTHEAQSDKQVGFQNEGNF
jgi:hypothetical protein